jgi:hypothetical protein
MVRIGSGALLALLVSCAPVAAWSEMADDGPPIVWTALRQADAKALLVEVGAVIKTESQTDEKGWKIVAEIPDGLPLIWTGSVCKGDGGDLSCTEYDITISLKAASVKAAKTIALERNVMFLADAAIDDEYVIWRMGFTYGGVTRAYLKNVLSITIDMGWDAAKVVDAGKK